MFHTVLDIKRNQCLDGWPVFAATMSSTKSRPLLSSFLSLGYLSGIPLASDLTSEYASLLGTALRGEQRKSPLMIHKTMKCYSRSRLLGRFTVTSTSSRARYLCPPLRRTTYSLISHPVFRPKVQSPAVAFKRALLSTFWSVAPQSASCWQSQWSQRWVIAGTW